MSKSLSAFWREDASPDRVMELASIIQGANSILGVMGSDVAATWSTDSNSATYWTRVKQGGRVQDTRVLLDYTPLSGHPAPFAPTLVDEVIGYAVHEGGHCIWTDPSAADTIPTLLKQGGEPLASLPIPAVEPMVLRVDNIIEDAYIDYNVAKKWPVLGEYIHIARQAIAARRPIDYSRIAASEKPPYRHMVNLWLSVALYNYPIPTVVSDPVKKALAFLINDTITAIKAEKPAARFLLSFDCWKYLFLNFADVSAPLPKAPILRDNPTPPTPTPTAPKADADEDEDEDDAPTEPEENEAGDEDGDEEEPTKEPEKSESEPEEPEAGETGEKAEDDKPDKPDDKPDEDEDEGEDEDAGNDGAGSADGDKGEGSADGEAETPDPNDKPENPDSQPETDGDQSLAHLQSGAEEEPDPDMEEEEKESKGGDQAGEIGDLDDFDNREAKPVPAELLAEVESALIHEIEDLSKSVAEVLDVKPWEVKANTQKADYDADASNKVISTVKPEIAAIRRVFDRQTAVKSGYLTGKVTGRLDGRKLNRLFTGNPRIFKRHEVFQKLDMGVCLLADGSGSMISRMDTVYQTTAVFAEALIRKPGVDFLALVYTGGMYRCETTRICDRSMPHLCLKNVSTGGGTPTATALASAKVLMERMQGRQKVIIHFTDGEPDDEVAVKTVVGKLRDDGYTVWGIAPQGYEKQMLYQYGEGNYETIESIPDLPQKVAELVTRLTK